MKFPSTLRHHEAAHAVAAWYQGERVNKIKLFPETKELTSYGFAEITVPEIKSREDVVERIAVCLAGPIAHVKAGKLPQDLIWEASSFNSDITEVMELDDIDPDNGLMEDGFVLAKEIVCKHWKAIQEVAKLIGEKEETDGREVMKLLFDGWYKNQWPNPKRLHGGNNCVRLEA